MFIEIIEKLMAIDYLLKNVTQRLENEIDTRKTALKIVLKK